MVPTNKEEFNNKLETLNKKFEELKPEMELTVRDPELGVEGYVIVYSTLAAKGGPLGRVGKGGTRITPTVSKDEIMMLARIMTLKNAAAGLPLGGAKSGMHADPDAADFEKKYRRFVRLASPTLYGNGGIWGGLGFDIGARPEHPHWACDELDSLKCFTGKPMDMGGTDYDKEGVAGLGVAVAAKTLLEVKNEDITKITCAIQGIGAMGAAVVRYFSEFGASINYISDLRIDGTYYFADGLSDELIASIAAGNFAKTNELIKASQAEKLPLEDVLYQEVDLLFPCALQDVVNRDNVDQIKAKYLVEGANNPLSSEARTMLFERGVPVVPDFIANPGGIIAAFVEMTSDISPEENVRTKANSEKAKEMTRKKIAENVRKIIKIADEFSVEPVEAGRYLALTNIFKDAE